MKENNALESSDSLQCHILCSFVFCPLPFSSRGPRTEALSSEYKIDQADFTERMAFLSTNFIEEINLIQKYSAQTPKTFH